MALSNEIVKEHMSSLFGEKRLSIVLQQLSLTSNPLEREKIIIENFCIVLKENGSNFVLPFLFKNDNGSRTNHYLFFITKNFLGFEIMKEIMRKESSIYGEGALSFGYNPIYKQGTLLYSPEPPLNILIDSLKEYERQSIPFIDLYKNHSIDNIYIKKEYKNALKLMVNNGKLTIGPNFPKKLRKNTVPDDSLLIFGDNL
jgi:hypothetical protein